MYQVQTKCFSCTATCFVINTFILETLSRVPSRWWGAPRMCCRYQWQIWGLLAPSSYSASLWVNGDLKQSLKRTGIWGRGWDQVRPHTEKAPELKPRQHATGRWWPQHSCQDVARWVTDGKSWDLLKMHSSGWSSPTPQHSSLDDETLLEGEVTNQ